MTTSGNAWLAIENTDPVTRFVAETAVPTPGSAAISLTGPSSVGGVQYDLASFELCLISFGGAYVNAVSVIGIAWFDSNANDPCLDLLSDSTERRTGCHTYAVNGSVGQGACLRVDLANDGVGGYVHLSAVRSVWTPEAATQD